MNDPKPVMLVVDVGEGEIDLPRLIETMIVDLEVSGCGYVTVRLATPADHAEALGLSVGVLELAGAYLDERSERVPVEREQEFFDASTDLSKAAKLVRDAGEARAEDDGTPD